MIFRGKPQCGLQSKYRPQLPKLQRPVIFLSHPAHGRNPQSVAAGIGFAGEKRAAPRIPGRGGILADDEEHPLPDRQRQGNKTLTAGGKALTRLHRVIQQIR